MEYISKRIVIIVFSIFAGFTFLLSVTRELSLSKLIFYALVVLMVLLLLKFPILKKWEIKNPRLILLVICVIAFIPRIIWVNLIFVDPKSDFYTLHTLADALSQGKMLYPKYVSLFPHVFGYSKVLSVVYGIFGSTPTTAVYFNILVNMVILLLIYSFGKHFYDVKTGLIAALIYACWPSQIFYNTLVLTEPVYVLGVLFILWAYCRITGRSHGRFSLFIGFAVLGILAGLLKYIRPASLLVVLSIILHFLFIRNDNPNEKDIHKRLWFKVCLALVLFVTYSFTALIVLNGIERKVGMDVANQSGGFNLFVGMNASSNGKWSADDSALLQPMIDKGMSSSEIQDTFKDMGIERIKYMDLLTHIQHQINKNRVMWGSDSDSLGYTKLALSGKSRINLAKHFDWLSLISNSYYFVFLLLSLMSLILLREKLSSDSFVIMLYILGTVAVHMIVEVHGRYHYPVIPLFCVLASSVLTQECYSLSAVASKIRSIASGKKNKPEN